MDFQKQEFCPSLLPCPLLPLGPCGAQLSMPGWVIPPPQQMLGQTLVPVCPQAGLPGVELTVDEAAQLSWAGKELASPPPRVFLSFTPGRARLGESLEKRDWTSGRLPLPRKPLILCLLGLPPHHPGTERLEKDMKGPWASLCGGLWKALEHTIWLFTCLLTPIPQVGTHQRELCLVTFLVFIPWAGFQFKVAVDAASRGWLGEPRGRPSCGCPGVVGGLLGRLGTTRLYWGQARD